MNILRMGVIGIGNMGSAHAVQFFENRVKDAVLTAVCDISEERLRWAEERFGGRVLLYKDYRQLLSDRKADAILIATPHKLHPVIAGEAFQQGLSVLTEKPAGIDTASVRKMNRAALESGKTFGIMYNQRTNPLYKKLRELVQDGTLGEVKRFVWIVSNWYRTQAYYDSGDWRGTWNEEGGGILINQCPHNLDIWQWIAGMPKRVRAFCHTGHFHHISVEDDVTVYAEYESGATAVFISSTGEYPGTNRLEISGTGGKAVIENGVLKLYLLKRDEREICFRSTEGMPGEEFEISEIRQEGEEAGHLGILQNFTNAVLYGEELIAPGAEGICGLTLSNAAYLSSWKDEWVCLPMDEQEYCRYLSRKQKEEFLPRRKIVQEEMTGEYSGRWNVRW